MTKEELEKRAKEYARKDVYYGAYVDDEAGMEIAEEAYIEATERETKLLQERIAELEAQIEKMKCWCNCKNYLSCLEECCRKNISFEKGICYNCKKWELRR